MGRSRDSSPSSPGSRWTGAALAASLLLCLLFGMDPLGALVLSSPSALALLMVRLRRGQGGRWAVVTAAGLTWVEVALFLPFWLLGVLFVPSAVLLTLGARRWRAAEG